MIKISNVNSFELNEKSVQLCSLLLYQADGFLLVRS